MKRFRLLTLCLLLCMSLAVMASAFTAKLYKEDGKTLIKSVTFEKGVSTSIPDEKHTEDRYFLGFETADGKQLHRYNIHTEYEGDLDITAKFLTRREMIPGENFIENGTFDADDICMTPSNGSFKIVTEKNGNRVLEYSRGSAYASIQHYTKWEPGRKYRVSYRYMIPKATTVKCTVNPRYFESQQEIDSNNAADNSVEGKAGNAGEWISHTVDFAIRETCISHYNRDALSLYCEPIAPEGSEDRNGIVYYDDIELIPYHKITYNANGGTISGSNTEYYLNGTYTVNSAIVPAREGYAFLGWGRTPDASANVSEIELGGKDITLYARWQGAESQPVFMYNFANDTKGIADGSMSIIAKDAAEGYTNVTLYYADEDGILEGYTPLKSLKITDSVATYGINGKRAFPMEATKIYVVFSAEGKSDYTYVYDIPADKRITEKKEPVVSFYSLSDFHNAGAGDYVLDGRAVTYTRENAIRDIFANKDRYEFVLMNGDNVCHSKAAHYAEFQKMLDRFNAEGVPAFFNTGNHEFHVSINGSESPKLEGGDEEKFLEMLDKHQVVLEGMGYTLDREPGGWYYSFEAKGIKFIMTATPYPDYSKDGCDYAIEGEQLKWLERQLFDAEKSNKPVFVLSHIGIAEYIPPKFSNSGGITNHAELKEVLNRHANLFYGSAHTHTNINVDWHTVAAGNQTTQFTHYNEGSVAYCYEYDENFNQLGYETDYSIGYCIDIYDDMVVFQGRMFDDVEDGGSKYISHATYQIMMPGADKDLPTLILDGKVEDGAVITPKFDKAYSGKIASYAWYLDSKVVSNESTYKVSVNDETCGKQIACRVTFEDGTYVSALSEKIPGYVVTYDVNGGESAAIAPQDVVPGAEFIPNALSKNPTMPNHYFAGWSVNKDATEPDAKFVANGNMTLYAVYKAGCTISYDANGGTGNVPVSHVVPKGVFQPAIAGGAPQKTGYYFVGWADTKNAAEPMASVYAKSDMTLYAVYTDEPKWYFDANLSGFAPNTLVTSYHIEDGKLYYSNKGASSHDPQFENKTVSFMAEDYPILRTKLYGTDASGNPSDRVFDTVFFKSETSGYTETKTKIPLWYSLKVAEADGMHILEIVIADRTSTSEYKGKISSLRFDPLSGSGLDGYADYLVFTDKRGIFKAHATVDDNGNVTLSEDTVNCTAKANVTKTLLGETVTVTLTPNEGYEFTTREDVLALTTINGKRPDGATVLKDGSAVIYLGEENALSFGDVSGDTDKTSVKIDKAVENKDFVIALYSGGVLCGLRTVTGADAQNGFVDIVADASLNADTVKIFAFDTLNSVSPVSVPFVAYFG